MGSRCCGSPVAFWVKRAPEPHRAGPGGLAGEPPPHQDLQSPEEEADAIINGKREIKDGHHAIIIDDDGAKKYFKRSNNKWTPAPKMNDCDLQKKCVEFKDGCKDTNAAIEAIKQKQLAKILEYFNE